MSKKVKNKVESGDLWKYGYPDLTKEIPIRAGLFKRVADLLEKVLHDNMKATYPQRYTWVNDKGDKIENPTKEERKDLTYTLDIQATLENDTPDVNYTPLGLEIEGMLLEFMHQHKENVENGLAEDVSEPELGVVK